MSNLNKIIEEIEEVERSANGQIDQQILNLDQLEHWRIFFLGRNGEISKLMKYLSSVSDENKKLFFNGQPGYPHQGEPAQCKCLYGWTGDSCENKRCSPRDKEYTWTTYGNELKYISSNFVQTIVNTDNLSQNDFIKLLKVGIT